MDTEVILWILGAGQSLLVIIFASLRGDIKDITRSVNDHHQNFDVHCKRKYVVCEPNIQGQPS